jgi:hypothetical protein
MQADIYVFYSGQYVYLGRFPVAQVGAIIGAIGTAGSLLPPWVPPGSYMLVRPA